VGKKELSFIFDIHNVSSTKAIEESTEGSNIIWIAEGSCYTPDGWTILDAYSLYLPGIDQLGSDALVTAIIDTFNQ
jgi:hypothetical protein